MQSLCRYRILIIWVRADIIGNERIKYIYMQAKSRNFSHAWFQMADSFHTHREASAITIMVDRTVATVSVAERYALWQLSLDCAARHHPVLLQ